MPSGQNVFSLYPAAPPTPGNTVASDPLTFMGNLLNLRGQQIANDTAQFRLGAAQNGYVTSALGALKDSPNISDDDIYSTVATMARNSNIPSSVLTGWLDSLPSDPAARRARLTDLANMAIGPSGLATRVPGPPTAAGAPTSTSLGQAQAAGTYPISTPPGFETRAVGGAQSDVNLANNLSSAAEGSAGRVALLGNLDDTLQKFTSGPGADWTKVAKAFVNRNVPLPAGWQFSPSSIASQEEFAKQSTQLAQQQFAAIGGTGTDAKFASAFETNPNETLSQLGNHNIIALLKGNERALQAKNNAWLQESAANPNLSYRQFSAGFNANFDPRAFQFAYLSPTERQAYYSAMNPVDKTQFLRALTVARKKGWIDFGVGQ